MWTSMQMLPDLKNKFGRLYILVNTNGSTVFGVSAVVEHLFYCSNIHFSCLSCRGTRHLLEVVPTCDNNDPPTCPGNYLILVNTVKLLVKGSNDQRNFQPLHNSYPVQSLFFSSERLISLYPEISARMINVSRTA